MGVPKFFRWLYERYPCLCEVVREYEIPEFDNLYLDMNGIIHTCSHPNDFDPAFRITEEKIFKDIFHYIEILFRMIQPRKLFFMAVDGVAPRAKLNQQRGRRFRTAKEAIELEKKAIENGDQLPIDKRFDSNCITPGTEFMERLQHQLRYFIADKMSNDKLWKNLKVILSGHETPGEGEHKIMDYIRYMKSQPDYDHNTRHCLYGLDADLIMLGLCTHEPHFSLLREEVKFGKKAKRATMPEGTKFYLLHLSIMRGYLDWEFSSLKDKLPFGYDIESIIDDWVLMGFLVGNDFIPHLPGLHIANGALQILHKAYMDVLPTLGGYINEGGTLVLSRFQRYMEKLAAFDIHQFKDEYADLKYFEGKTGRKMGTGKERPKFFNSPDEIGSMDPKLQEMIMFTEQLEEMAIAHDKKDEDLEQLFGGIEDDLEEDDEDDDDDDGPVDPAMFQEFFQKKRDYYTNKLDFEKVTPEVLRSQAEGYVRAIQWNLNYYYNGVCSWSWFYPHHYAPYISDIKNFCELDIQFEMGRPFLPFQQLLAVLPSLSKDLLPEAFHSLMEDENSPIIDYYPTAFQTDLNGKRQEWEAVVLIPFIDEGRLLAAMGPLEGKLSEEEKRRNKHGPMLVYTYSGKSVGSFEAPYFPKIHSNHALEKRVMREEIYVPIEKLVKGLCPNVLLCVHFPGIPSLRHVPHKASLEKGKVKVFESPSRNESMIIEILNDEIIQWKKDTAVIAKELLGHSFLVSWPHLRESKVIEVLDRKSIYSLTSNSKTKGQANDSKSNASKLQLKVDATNEDKFKLEEQSIREQYATHLGIKLGPISVIVHTLPLAGWKYAFAPSGGVTLEKQWGNIHSSIALQTVVKDVKIMGPKITECNTIHEMFPPKTTVFLLSNPHYGSMGRVANITPATAGKVALVQISLDVLPEPDMDKIKAQLIQKGMKYYPGGVAAQRVGISGHLLSRVTGTIFISQSDTDAFSKATNIGLSLKFNKRNEEVPGYTKKDYNNMWLYSEKCVELLASYCEKFPDVFHFLSENTRSNEFQEAAVFPSSSIGGTTLKQVVDWLSQQPHSQVEHRKCGTETLDEDIVLGIENEIQKIESILMDKKKKITMKVQPHLLYKPGFKMGYMQPDRSTKYFLYDRVTNVRECFTVPLGLRGTVMGIHRSDRPEDTLYDIVFDSPFDGGASIGGCSRGKGYRLPAYALINLSHGARCLKGGNTDILAVSKTNSQAASSVLPSGYVLTRYSNPFAGISDLDGSKTVERYSRVPDRPASAFASWRSGCTGFGPNTPLSNIPTKDGNPDDISSGPPPPKLDSSFKGKDPTILRRPAPNPLTTPQLQQPPDQLQSSNCSVEFQAMWKELQKSGGNAPSGKTSELKPIGAFPFVLGVNQLATAEVPISDQVKDSGTDFLKKILRIDSSPSSSASSSISSGTQPAPQNITSPAKEINQPSVQDFFEKAKAAKQQELNQKAPCNHCLKLISMFQRTGLGIPRYDYVMIENGMTIANLSMPSGKVLQGDPAPTREKASQNVAKLAIAQMSKWPKQEAQFSALPANKLPAPPQQWYQQGSPQMSPQQHMMPFQNQASWQHGNMYQKLNWRDNPDQANDWRKRTANGQWQAIRPPSNQSVFPQKYVQPPFAFNSFPQYQGQQPHAQPASWSSNSNHTVWRQPPHGQQSKPPEATFPPGVNGPAVSNPFVPLQAVRAQMSAHSHQVQLPKKQNDVPKRNAMDEAKSTEITGEVMPSDPGNNSCGEEVTAASQSAQVDPKKQLSAESASEESGDDNKRPSNGSGTRSKNRETKPVYVPPHARKSRLAINFGNKE